MFGMTEEQFWRSNPRIIKVYEESWKEEQNRLNHLAHFFVGNYVLSAMVTAVSGVMQPMLTKSHSKSKYIEEPVRLFPMTEEEREYEKEKATKQFIEWANALEEQVKKNH